MTHSRKQATLCIYALIATCVAHTHRAVATPEAGEDERTAYEATVKEVGAVNWQRHGDWIAFVRDGDDKENQQFLYKIKADGTGLTQLTTSGDDGGPVWSPDGNSIAFASSQAGGDFCKMDATGANIVSLGSHPGAFQVASWSPDGLRLAFITRRGDGGPYVAIMSAVGNEQSFVTDAFEADWHPSEPYVVVEADAPDGKTHLFEVNLATRDRRQITFGNYDDESPRYSPDGQWIAFISHDRGHEANAGSCICLVQRDGAGLYCLPLHDSDEWEYCQPDFSPDGQYLIFGRGRCAATDLYKCRLDGSELHNVTGFYPD